MIKFQLREKLAGMACTGMASFQGCSSSWTWSKNNNNNKKRPWPAFSKIRASAAQPGAEQLSDGKTAKVELTSFLKTVEVDSDTDPLGWWKCNQANFNQARKYLVSPAISVPSETAVTHGWEHCHLSRDCSETRCWQWMVLLAENEWYLDKLQLLEPVCARVIWTFRYSECFLLIGTYWSCEFKENTLCLRSYIWVFK